MARGTKRDAGSCLVVIPWELRKLLKNAWLEEGALSAKSELIATRRAQERTRGRMLKPRELAHYAEQYRAIQRTIYGLSRRRKELIEALVIHWGYTGIERIVSPSGTTDVILSMSIYEDPKVLQAELSEEDWDSITLPIRILDLQRLLAVAAHNPRVKAAVLKAVRAQNLKVAMRAPGVAQEPEEEEVLESI